MSLAASILAGDRLALTRLLSYIENGTAEGRAALSELFPYTGRAHLIGVTGPPGAGKSSLVNHLARHYRIPPDGTPPRRVAIIAVDPTSPFSGGAILGDRLRMRDLAGDAGVFIRSMASRGSLGGLATATAGVAQVFDAAGFETILIETVGAGQAEVDIARLAHTTLVVETPGAGDDIQAIKAGILEIADILVLNKADQPGADSVERALRTMLELAHPTPHIFQDHPPVETAAMPASPQPMWLPPILRTIATRGTGIAELASAIAQHAAYLRQSGEWQRRERYRLEAELNTALREILMARWQASIPQARYREIVESVAARRLSPGEAVEKLLNSFGGAHAPPADPALD